VTIWVEISDVFVCIQSCCFGLIDHGLALWQYLDCRAKVLDIYGYSYNSIILLDKGLNLLFYILNNYGLIIAVLTFSIRLCCLYLWNQAGVRVSSISFSKTLL